jgi:hypothetical protein
VQTTYNKQENSGEQECGAEKDQEFGEVGHDGGTKPLFILASLCGAEALLFHGVHWVHFHSEGA